MVFSGDPAGVVIFGAFFSGVAKHPPEGEAWGRGRPGEVSQQRKNKKGSYNGKNPFQSLGKNFSKKVLTNNENMVQCKRG